MVTFPEDALVTLPVDEAPHGDPIEWWYFNGFLTDDKGGEYSFHYVAFQAPPADFGVPHLVRVTLDAPGDEPHLQAERVVFMEEESGAPSVYLDSDGWVMRGDGNGNYDVALDVDGIFLELEVSPAREPVFHYKGTGYTNFGPDLWAYYYSYTRQHMTGFVEDESGRRPVTGISWYDHQWGRVENRNTGWDWFGVQLDDGSDLMITHLWMPENGERRALYGTYVTPEGAVLHLDGDALAIEATRTWTSEATGVTYPVAWAVESDPLELSLEVTARNEGAEIVAEVSYWEGAIGVLGTRTGSPVSGRGFAELVGYDPKQLEETTDPLPVP